jgi:protein-S-isoprenylcysteine O-methyltransferase Ste14
MRVPIPAIVIPVVVALVYWLLPGERELPWTPVRVVGAVLAVTGYVLVWLARVQLGRSFSVRSVAHELVTTGLYSRIRNPIYVFADLMFLGLVLVLRLYWLMPVIPILVAVQIYKSRNESRVLEAAFGQAYRDYRKRSWF